MSGGFEVQVDDTLGVVERSGDRLVCRTADTFAGGRGGNEVVVWLSPNPPDRCEAEAPNWACCCQCQHLLRDVSHPTTDGGRLSQQKGWICNNPDFQGVAISGWSLHGLCECFDPLRAG